MEVTFLSPGANAGLPVLVASFLFVSPLPLTAQATPLVLPAQDIGEEHYGDPPEVPEGERWLGLYVDADSSWIQPVEVDWERRELEGLGRHVYIVRPDGAIVLMLGVPRVRIGRAETVLRWTESMYRGSESVDLPLRSTAYMVSVTAEDPQACDATVTLSDGERSQVLFTPALDPLECGEPHFDIHWAGDLDGDGRLDLLTTFSMKYSGHPRRLYLSSAAAPGDLVGQVVLFER